MIDDERDREQAAIFERLSQRVSRLLERYGRPDTLLGPGDYSVYCDYWGYPQVKVSVGDLGPCDPRSSKCCRES